MARGAVWFMEAIAVAAEMPAKGPTWIASPKDWVLIAGFLLILLVAVSLPKEDKGAARPFYAVACVTWLCAVEILEFRHGLVTQLGIPDAFSWALAPIALILLIALPLVPGLLFTKKTRWWKRISFGALWLVAVVGYMTVAAHHGLSTWVK